MSRGGLGGGRGCGDGGIYLRGMYSGCHCCGDVDDAVMENDEDEASKSR